MAAVINDVWCKCGRLAIPVAYFENDEYILKCVRCGIIFDGTTSYLGEPIIGYAPLNGDLISEAASVLGYISRPANNEKISKKKQKKSLHIEYNVI